MDNYTIPEICTHVKIDIGLSYNAPQSQDWLSKEKDLMVFGFEPNPESVDCIMKGNIHKKHPINTNQLENKFIDEKRFHIFPVALSNIEKVEKMDFWVNANDAGTSSLFAHYEKELGPIKSCIEVPVFSLKMFFDSFPWDRFTYIDYIKIDAQGSDLNILKGAGDYLKEKVVYVTAEPDGHQYIGAHECNENNINNYMNSQGFTRINHENTSDPTYINNKFLNLKNIYICQI
jgi:FkbM family methyltransferase